MSYMRCSCSSIDQGDNIIIVPMGEEKRNRIEPPNESVPVRSLDIAVSMSDDANHGAGVLGSASGCRLGDDTTGGSFERILVCWFKTWITAYTAPIVTKAFRANETIHHK
mmetsp:Transcript_10565/g.20265  ORF Transcript_10565/g.20265 Transcript_10565/m.20265 type:complete len:110 (-) Transcript_10565:137-466(-)